jgi:hypothetical protein
MRDLIVLCADKKIEHTIGGLLDRTAALRIRPITYDIKVHSGRDPGCFFHAHSFLRPLRVEYDHALVVFDQAWEGAPVQRSEDLERSLTERLRLDWSDKGACVVISPELEVWVWSDSPHVQKQLCWPARRGDLRLWLESRGFWVAGAPKPTDPKAAVETVVREVRVPWTAAMCRSLAAKVSTERCSDPAFRRFLEIIRNWFGKPLAE